MDIISLCYKWRLEKLKYENINAAPGKYVLTVQ